MRNIFDSTLTQMETPVMEITDNKDSLDNQEMQASTVPLSEQSSKQRDNSNRAFPIAISGLSKYYKGKGGGVWAIREINLTIEPGVFGLLGRNGAGKTTMLQILATLLEATEGTVHIGPYDVRRDRWPIRSHLGYLPQEQGFYPMLTTEETLRYLAILRGLDPIAPAVKRALEAVNLTDRAHSRVSALSGGMRRRLGLAQALLGDPSIVIVDEPTAGLDPVEQQRFRTLLSTLGAQGDRTIILSTHIVADVATAARRLAVLERGSLVFQGSVGELTARARGQVWQCRTTIDMVELTRKHKSLIITSLTPTDDSTEEVIARVVGEQPDTRATACEPTLEDGYFALVGRADQDEDN